MCSVTTQVSKNQITDLTNFNLKWNIFIYYIKVSGIPNGNKLIKTIRYPHMWRYRWFHCYEVCLLNCTFIRWCIIETSSGLRVFLNSLRQPEIFGIFRKMFGKVLLAFGKILEIFGNLRKVVGNLRETIKKAVITDFYLIKKTLQVSSKIWILCSRGKNNISLVRCPHSWDTALATRT